MSKNKNIMPSKKVRKAEVEARKARQRRNWMIVGGVFLFLVIAVIGWQVYSNSNSNANGERPLASLPPRRKKRILRCSTRNGHRSQQRLPGHHPN